ncbi:MAG: hypothetical protein MK297_00825 [Planctomycetes bacterium]|nr:hypothetical protein [Planctomycetota bacterium]
MTQFIATTVTLLIAFSFPSFAGTSAGTVAGVFAQDDDPEVIYKERREEAGKDPVKLWELHLWCEAYGMEKEAKSCARAVVKYDESHKEAHEYLGHVFYDGQWFTSERKLERYKKEEEERMAKEKGLVRYKDEWVPEEDLPFLKKGLVKDESGKWVNKEEREKILAGWIKQDTQWVHPDNAGKIEAGLWKCGDEWLETEKANAYHAKLSSWWTIPDPVFLLHSTCDREVAEKALTEMHIALREVKRVLGTAPTTPVNVAMLRDAKQYGSYAAGNDTRGRPPVEITGKSSVHHAFMAELWIDPEQGVHMGAGVGYWNPEVSDGAFGPFSARHAAAIGILEQLDPSPKAIEKVLKNPTGFNPQKFLADHHKEKRLPAWFREGICSYAERWLLDSSIRKGGDAEKWRTWSASNIINKGGLRPIKKIFTDEVSVDNPDSAKLLNERGLLIAFLLDGEIDELKEKHFELKQKFKKGESVSATIKSIEKSIIKHEQELRKFAGL